MGADPHRAEDGEERPDAANQVAGFFRPSSLVVKVSLLALARPSLPRGADYKQKNKDKQRIYKYVYRNIICLYSKSSRNIDI